MPDWLCRAYHAAHRFLFFGGGLLLPFVELEKREPLDILDWRYHFSCKRCGLKWSVDV